MHYISGNEKQVYEEPEICLFDLTEEDIIVTSGESGGDSGGDEGSGKDWTGEWDTDF